jgi:tetratricopeptide (TPR) repeat protein
MQEDGIEVLLFADQIIPMVRRALAEGTALTAELQMFIGRNRELTKKFIEFACQRATSDLEYMLFAAIVAGVYDQSFWSQGDELLESLLAQAAQIGAHAQAIVQKVIDTYVSSYVQFYEQAELRMRERIEGEGKPFRLSTPGMDWSPVPGRPSAKVNARAVLHKGEEIGLRYVVTDDPPVAGGYGIVYTLRRNDSFGGFVGKVPKYPVTEDSGQISAFEETWRTEAIHCMAISAHPNVLEPMRLERTRAGPMLISKEIRGSTLDTVIAARNLNFEDRVFVALDVLLGMEFLYRQNAQLHLDLCPRNIMYGHKPLFERSNDPDKIAVMLHEMLETSRHPAAILIDFGFSVELLKHFPKVEIDGTEAFEEIDTASIAHWSPEHFSTSSTLSAPTDIYSFGILLFQLLTWKLPFEPASVDSLLQFHQQRRLVWPDQMQTPDLGDIRRVTEKCLRKNGLSLYNDWTELLADFSCAIEDFFERTGAGEALARARGAPERAQVYVAASRSDARALEKGEVLASLGEYGAAIAIARDVMDRASWSPRARHLLAHSLLERGDRQAAAEEYDRVIAEEPSDVGARTSRGLLRMKGGDLEGALADFRVAMLVHQRSPHVCLTFANICVLTKRFPAAIGAYLHAMELTPEARPTIVAKMEETCGMAGWNALTDERKEEARRELLQELGTGGMPAHVREGERIDQEDPRKPPFGGYTFVTSPARLNSPVKWLIYLGTGIAGVGDDFFVRISAELTVSEPIAHERRRFISSDPEGTIATWHQGKRSIDIFGVNGLRKIGPIGKLFADDRGEKLLHDDEQDDDDVHLGAVWRNGERLFLARRSGGTNLAAIDSRGQLQWKASVNDGVQEILVTAGDVGDLLLLAASNHEVTAFTGDGRRLWQFVPREFTGLESYLGSDRIRLVAHLSEWEAFIISTTVENPTGFVLDESGDVITVYCVGEDGAVRWRHRFPFPALRAVAIGADKVALACSTVLENSPKLDLVAVVDSVGRPCWMRPLSGVVLTMFFDPERCALTIICNDGQCFVFGEDGSRQHHIDLPIEKVSDARAIAGNIVLASGNELHLLRGID